MGVQVGRQVKSTSRRAFETLLARLANFRQARAPLPEVTSNEVNINDLSAMTTGALSLASNLEPQVKWLLSALLGLKNCTINNNK